MRRCRSRCALVLLLILALTACGGSGTLPQVETESSQAGAESPQVETESSQIETEPTQAETEPVQVETEPPQVEAEPSQAETPPMQTETEPPQAETELPAVEPAEAETLSKTEQSPGLPELLEQAGLELSQVQAGQLVVVESDGANARIYGFETDDSGQWQMALEAVDGHVGKNGVTEEKTEGDKMTPAGLFTLTCAFGVQPDPDCALPYRPVTEDSYWVDDPDSRFYNQWVEGTEEQDWDSAEHLCDYSTPYAYAIVVDYNMEPVVPGAGSAIFLHCGARPTAGCISVPQETVLTLLKWLSPDCRPAILIF